ncbi:hypothetical protein [Aeromonas dhakensis]
MKINIKREGDTKQKKPRRRLDDKLEDQGNKEGKLVAGAGFEPTTFGL